MATAKAPTTGVSKTGGKTSPRSGKAMGGKPPKPSFSETTQPVAVVEVSVRCPIIHILKSTGNLNTSSLTTQKPYATFVTTGFTPESSSVLCVERFERSWPVLRALDALAKAIEYELKRTDTIAMRAGASTTGSGIGTRIPKNTSTKKPGSG